MNRRRLAALGVVCFCVGLLAGFLATHSEDEPSRVVNTVTEVITESSTRTVTETQPPVTVTQEETVTVYRGELPKTG